MSVEMPDFSIIERTIEHRLQGMNLSPRRIADYVETGYDKFEIHRKQTQILLQKGKNEPITDQPNILFVSSEILAKLHHPSFGSVEIVDLISFQGTSAMDTLERCANTYMDVTFPALQSLYEGKSAEGTMKLKLSSLTGSSGTPLQWEVFTGQLQILNDNDGWLTEQLKQSPLALVLGTVSGYLAHPQLHWCKLFGKFYSKDQIVFGCSIDGRKSPEAEAEMLRKFGAVDNTPRNWEFRQFFVMRPTSAVDEERIRMAETLRKTALEDASTSQPKPTERKSWYSK